MANIIYLDQPVGAGFSYSRNPFADIPSDTGSVKRVDEFVRKVNSLSLFYRLIVVHNQDLKQSVFILLKL